jgi:hypothetical protein
MYLADIKFMRLCYIVFCILFIVRLQKDKLY